MSNSAISHHTALIYTMVMVSAADRNMTDAELSVIGEIIRHLPIFKDFNQENLSEIAAACADILEVDDGLDQALQLVDASLPVELRETAYALACDVAAADGEVHQEEIRLLEMIRHGLEIDRLNAAAIERGARARFATLSDT